MRPGRYAAADGSFGRSAGVAMGRGVLLLAVALAIGIVLLNATEGDPPGTSISAGGDDGGGGNGAATTTTAPAATTTTAPPAHQPAEVKVIVANASNVSGAAGRASDQLKPKGYNVLAPTNAKDAAESAVYFVPGFEADAAAIAQELGLPPTAVKALPTPPPYDTKGANVAVVLGADAASRFAAAAGGTATTTTTAKAAASTTTTTAKR